MEWKIVNRNNPREQLPKNKQFLCLFKGCVCLCEFDDDVNNFYIGMMPATYLGFWKLDRDREQKITHFCELELPKDY